MRTPRTSSRSTSSSNRLNVRHCGRASRTPGHEHPPAAASGAAFVRSFGGSLNHHADPDASTLADTGISRNQVQPLTGSALEKRSKTTRKAARACPATADRVLRAPSTASRRAATNASPSTATAVSGGAEKRRGKRKGAGNGLFLLSRADPIAFTHPAGAQIVVESLIPDVKMPRRRFAKGRCPTPDPLWRSRRAFRLGRTTPAQVALCGVGHSPRSSPHPHPPIHAGELLSQIPAPFYSANPNLRENRQSPPVGDSRNLLKDYRSKVRKANVEEDIILVEPSHEGPLGREKTLPPTLEHTAGFLPIAYSGDREQPDR